jgi:hypothetical protein
VDRSARIIACLALIVALCGCTTPEPNAAGDEPVLVLESPGSTSESVEIIVLDLSGRELFRQSTGANDALPSLHQPTARVAFWRSTATGSAYELVVWDITTRSLRVMGSREIGPAVTPLWSIDGAEVITLHANGISWAPGASFEGNAEITVANMADGQLRSLATDRKFVPGSADARVITGDSLSADRAYVVIDARSGRTIRELAMPGAVGVMRTGNADVAIAMRETGTPGEVTLHAMNVTSGAELRQLGQVYAQPVPLWPGRNEVVFVAGAELHAFDFVANQTRVAGRFEGASYALSFDAPGKLLLAARLADLPVYGTFTVDSGKLTSAMRPINSTVLGRPLGLVRVKKTN